MDQCSFVLIDGICKHPRHTKKRLVETLYTVLFVGHLVLREEQRLAAWEQRAAHKSFVLHACSKHCELGMAWFPKISELQMELHNKCAKQDSSLYAVLFVGHLVLRGEQRLAAWKRGRPRSLLHFMHAQSTANQVWRGFLKSVNSRWNCRMNVQNKTTACICVLLGFVTLDLLSSTILAGPISVAFDDVPAVGLTGR